MECKIVEKLVRYADYAFSAALGAIAVGTVLLFFVLALL